MTATIIDGKAIAAELARQDRRRRRARHQGARATSRASRWCWSARIAASSVYVRSKAKAVAEAGMRAFDHKLPAATSEAELLALIAEAQRRRQRQRHPGAVAAAAADRRAQDHLRHRSGQGRRRLPPAQCRAAGERPAGAGAVHAARLRAAGEIGACFARRHGGGGGRPLQHRRQAGGAAAARRERHRHHRPFQDARSAGGVPARRLAGRRHRQAGDGARRLDQAGRHRDRRRHQPRAGRGRG